MRHHLDDIKNDNEADEATENLKSIFPNVASEKFAKMTAIKLMKTRKLSGILGTKRDLFSSTAKGLHDQIKSYIDSSNESDNGTLWPLIKIVEIYTNSPILKGELLLVDPSSVGDSNTARSAVTLDYINKLDHIWIVADIVRAVSNKVAKELLSGSFRYRLSMDDK